MNFVLKDANGVELNFNDSVVYVCNTSGEPCVQSSKIESVTFNRDGTNIIYLFDATVHNSSNVILMTTLFSGEAKKKSDTRTVVADPPVLPEVNTAIAITPIPDKEAIAITPIPVKEVASDRKRCPTCFIVNQNPKACFRSDCSQRNIK